MAHCSGCGHPLGVGRFCTNCGRPVAPPAVDDTAERPAVPASATSLPPGPPPPFPPPPAPADTPPPARYPLYADEVQPEPTPRRTEVPWKPAALGAGVLVLVGVVGGLLLFAGGDDGGPAARDSAAAATAEQEPEPEAEELPPATDEPEDLARYAAPTAPRTAKPNLDTRGNLVRYEAAHLVDGVEQTCWRTPGDGAGLELSFEFPAPVELTEVGLINGYAKRSGALDWYAGNRRVLEVEWVLDDGTVVAQTLSRSREVQTVPVDAVTTSTVRLRLVSVSEPGRGPSARNYTAISDVSLVGTPG